MKVLELMEALEVLNPEAEVFVESNLVVREIELVSDDSQGVYVVADSLAEDKRRW